MTLPWRGDVEFLSYELHYEINNLYTPYQNAKQKNMLSHLMTITDIFGFKYLLSLLCSVCFVNLNPHIS
jgi:hypothetical protein